MIETLAFYLFAVITLFSAIMVITAKNPVVSVLFLILAFFNAAGLFVLMGAEFVAMILVIVYVGAVAVLFLFVVMMLDISFSDLRKGAMRYVPLGILIGAVLLAELIIVYVGWEINPPFVSLPLPADVTNTEAIGRILYTDYLPIFQLSGLVLLVAMIGAIVLTHRTRAGVRRQNTEGQKAIRPEDILSIRKISSGRGIDP